MVRNLQGTKVEGVISRLFEGHIQKSITCLNVPYKSAKRDAYMDIFLDVRNSAAAILDRTTLQDLVARNRKVVAGRKRAERSLDLVHGHAWHLKQLLPDATAVGTSAPSPAGPAPSTPPASQP